MSNSIQFNSIQIQMNQIRRIWNAMKTPIDTIDWIEIRSGFTRDSNPDQCQTGNAAAAHKPFYVDGSLFGQTITIRLIDHTPSACTAMKRIDSLAALAHSALAVHPVRPPTQRHDRMEPCVTAFHAINNIINLY